MHKAGAYVAEIILLFAALFFTLTPLPSNDIERLPLMPGAAFAISLFVASRALRWRRLYPIIVAEAALFAAFVFAANAVANALYKL